MTAPARLFHEFASRPELAEALAGDVASALQSAISERGAATIAVSGGTTPALFFRALAKQELDWSKVTVTLVDERFVEPGSPRSNQGLVTENLLQGAAASARLVPLYHPVADAAEAAQLSSKALAELGWPLDVVVLGMGGDGHTASFFPDANELKQLLDPDSDAIVTTVTAPSAGETRSTQVMARLVGARLLVLHIEGAEKRKVFNQVTQGSPQAPIAVVLAHAATAPNIYWAA